uniref:Uncharacterized protein n=1 Tax=uncultured bacterium A1Q1_fos_1877 TaxID=1256555 RepID=L7VS29_9BACT|nr:hypothetical protein [uncultured bacterium A1Q1_fos_1877]
MNSVSLRNRKKMPGRNHQQTLWTLRIFCAQVALTVVV